MSTLRSRHVRNRARRGAGVPVALLGLTTTLLLTSCGTGSGGSGGEPTVVASTDTWAKVAEAVAGEHAEVESIISDNEADPHSYESTPRDAAKINQADLVVHNGGGYDSFVSQVLSGNSADTPSVEAVAAAETEEGHGSHESTEQPAESSHAASEHAEHSEDHSHAHSGNEHEHTHDHAHSGNEHVWYQPHSVRRVADRIAEELSGISPDRSADFEQAAAEFGRRLDEVDGDIAEIRQQHRGTEVLTTAPVADLLLDETGLNDITPRSYVQSVESGNDPAASTIAELQDLVDSGRPAVLIHNPQTASPLTERLRERAERNGIPVVSMPETLPADETYQQWISGRVSALQAALDKAPTPQR
ncbi:MULTISPECIES: zinc ABC transporter substrate-binding protein [unclassified Actinopolyspora]|uniref:metal ABC transporter solute-binding protein, Zn/Mn family n=1 Tax=unclassified Actinopolyspora TaxID=2639451 RepID=UPI0013F63D65|nr:zinc ABC transporter solute-binding protein [Actinopolyspora sp. BKK2]NHE76984.1 zinc ABC transporter solute-binding protein [Actinopolyspora sp. BKK1]